MKKHKINTKTITIIITSLAILNCILILLFINYIKQTINNDKFHEYVIGESTRVGYAGVELHYDVEPVDIYLIDQTGKEFSKNYVSLYENDTDNKVMKLMMDTDKLGTWSIKLNKKKNNHITYKFINIPSNTLYLQDVNINEKGGVYVLSFVPVCGEPTDTETLCKYSISMTGNDKSYLLGSDETGINQTIDVPLEFDDSAYDDSDYSLVLAVMMSDNNTNKTRTSMTLHLSNKKGKK